VPTTDTSINDTSINDAPGSQVNNGQPVEFAPPVLTPDGDITSIKVDFVEVLSNAKGDFVVLRFTNTTDRKVTGIRGSVRAYDQQGHIVRGYGYTSDVFNQEPGASVDYPILKIKPDGPFAARRKSLGQLNYLYVAREITFAPED
jgi:hypothetical protein